MWFETFAGFCVLLLLVATATLYTAVKHFVRDELDLVIEECHRMGERADEFARDISDLVHGISRISKLIRHYAGEFALGDGFLHHQ